MVSIWVFTGPACVSASVQRENTGVLFELLKLWILSVYKGLFLLSKARKYFMTYTQYIIF